MMPARAINWTDRLRLILISALEVDKAVFFSAAITVAAFIPLFTMQGVEGQIFNPMARTYGFAMVGALIATFTVTPVLASLVIPEHVNEVETFFVTGTARCLFADSAMGAQHRKTMVVRVGRVPARYRPADPAARHRVPADIWKKAISGSARPCRRRSRSKPAIPTSTEFAKS